MSTLASSSTQRPVALAPIIETIPAELQVRPQWVVWRYEQCGTRWTKVPYTPGTTHRAASNRPSSWRSFREALACYQERPDYFDGIGYVFSADDPYVGGDFDHCLDTRGSLNDFARSFLPVTYAEVSPSGQGVKFITRASLAARYGGGRTMAIPLIQLPRDARRAAKERLVAGINHGLCWQAAAAAAGITTSAATVSTPQSLPIHKNGI